MIVDLASLCQLLLLITPISSLGNSFIPFLWATVIVAYHKMRHAEQRVGSPTGCLQRQPIACPERAS